MTEIPTQETFRQPVGVETRDDFLKRVEWLFDPRKRLLARAWLERDLPERDLLLGASLCTTSRWLIFGDTGVGKTLVAMAIGAAVASGKRFLGWEGSGRRRRVMYLDGELPAETFKERVALITKLYGTDIVFYGYNFEEGGVDRPPPLNTDEGQKWLLEEIKIVKPDVIIFDSVMSLLIGIMKEEESWAPMRPLVRRLTSLRIAQIWLHHTGHDKSKSFGTKTREWEMDTVICIAHADEEDEAIALEFRKARLRTPQNWQEFKSITIRCGENGFQIEGEVTKPKSRKAAPEVALIRGEIEKAHQHLAARVKATADEGFVTKVLVEDLREEVRRNGFLEIDKSGKLTPTGRSHWRRAKMALLASGEWMEKDGLIWRRPSGSGHGSRDASDNEIAF